MFARKIRVEYSTAEGAKPCPLKWLDSFAMRNFTNATEFDDTLPVSDGLMEIGTNVALDGMCKHMQHWFRAKGYLPQESGLVLTEIEVPPAGKSRKSS